MLLKKNQAAKITKKSDADFGGFVECRLILISRPMAVKNFTRL
jgi:hypothetical protein